MGQESKRAARVAAQTALKVSALEKRPHLNNRHRIRGQLRLRVGGKAVS